MRRLIWVYTVSSGMSVPILRAITVLNISKSFFLLFFFFFLHTRSRINFESKLVGIQTYNVTTQLGYIKAAANVVVHAFGKPCFHYKNTPIQIYRKFHLQKLKISDKKKI